MGNVTLYNVTWVTREVVPGGGVVVDGHAYSRYDMEPAPACPFGQAVMLHRQAMGLPPGRVIAIEMNGGVRDRQVAVIV